MNREHRRRKRAAFNQAVRHYKDLKLAISNMQRLAAEFEVEYRKVPLRSHAKKAGAIRDSLGVLHESMSDSEMNVESIFHEFNILPEEV
jgi:hypothetical protein